MREWKTRDKSDWGDGPWQDEPDKAQWVDEKTGLDCLIVRGPSGGLCGYVGVPETHPFFGKHYDGVEPYPDVHGGLTFSDGCREPTEEEWLKIKEKMGDERLLAEAEIYPNGDAARRLAELEEQSLLTFQEWQDYQQARRICHIPEAGRPDKVWWLGFDTAHSGDLTPAFAAISRKIGLDRPEYERNDTYKTLAYVRGEVENLALQIAAADTGTAIDQVEI